MNNECIAPRTEPRAALGIAPIDPVAQLVGVAREHSEDVDIDARQHLSARRARSSGGCSDASRIIASNHNRSWYVGSSLANAAFEVDEPRLVPSRRLHAL